MNFVDFFKLLRESSSAMAWSKGVELSRDGGVLVEKNEDTEAIFRISSPGRAVSNTVTLLFEDEDWVCDCRSTTNPCEHVTAAAIALKRAKEQGKPLPASTLKRGVVVYAFFEKEGALHLVRRIRSGAQETEMTHPLPHYAEGKSSGSPPGSPLSASKGDWKIETLLRDQKPIPALIQELLLELKNNINVSFEGEPIEVGPGGYELKATVVDTTEGVRLEFQRHPNIIKLFSNGAALCRDGLCALSVAPPAGSERGRVFLPTEFPELVSDLLPRLQRTMDVEIQSHKLPVIDEDLRPRLLFQTSASGDVLSVLPLVVYGNPPLARVDGGRLVFLENASRVPLRQISWENRLASALHSEWGLGVGRRVEFRGEAAERFSEQLDRSHYELVGSGRAHFSSAVPLVPHLKWGQDQLEIAFVGAGGETANSQRVFQAWREGVGRVSLDAGKGWAPVPLAWLEKYGHRVLALLEKGELPVHQRPEVARLGEELGFDCPVDFVRLKQQLETFQGIAPVTLPSDLKATLRPYQKRGVDWLGFLKASGLGALLADDMGLGKSLQTIAVLSGRTLIVCPTSVLLNWQKEINRFRPALSVGVYYGAARELDPSKDVNLTTYPILRLDQAALQKVEWDTLVLDEAQFIRNSESQAAQASFGLKGKFKIALSGTPIENRPEDLWSIFQFLNPGFLGTKNEFQKNYWSPDLNRLSDLRAKIKPFILRRLKKEVTPELPPRTEVTDYCELSSPEQIAYDAVKAATRSDVLKALGEKNNVLAVLESLLRLRQAACHRGLLPGQEADDSSKVRLLLEKLEAVVGGDHKALIFSQWTSLLDRIEPHLQRAKIAFTRIDGTTTDRQEVIDQFQSPAGPPVLLMTLKAGGVGLNLTAADHVFLVDPWWNPAAEDQAADRAHRIGQTRPVFVHRLVTRGTVEEKILALQEKKREQALSVLSGTRHSEGGGLSREDILGLIT